MLKFINKSKKNAFTLSELLIALGVIAILTAISMPIIHNLLPDQNVVMAKRAFYTTETIISNLLNDQYCYPKQRVAAGLDDGLGYIRCEKWGAEKNNAQTKLITLFADKLDVKETKNGGKTILTKDGMIWTFSDSQLKIGMPNSYIYLTVDVNGDKEPNCGQTSQSTQCQNSRKYGFDKFTMKILARGKIEIKDCWAKLAVRVDKKLTGREDITSDCKAIEKEELKARGCIVNMGDLCVKSQVQGGSDSDYNNMYKEIQKVDPSYSRPTYSGGNDNWQMSKDYCEKVVGGRLPTVAELAKIAEMLYPGSTFTEESARQQSARGQVFTGLDWSKNKDSVYKDIGVKESTDWLRIWSNESDTNNPNMGIYWVYIPYKTALAAMSKGRTNPNGSGSGPRALCIGE